MLCRDAATASGLVGGAGDFPVRSRNPRFPGLGSPASYGCRWSSPRWRPRRRLQQARVRRRRAGWSPGGEVQRGHSENEPDGDHGCGAQVGRGSHAGQQRAEQGDPKDAAGLAEGGKGARGDPGPGLVHAAEGAEVRAVTISPMPNPVTDSTERRAVTSFANVSQQDDEHSQTPTPMSRCRHSVERCVQWMGYRVGMGGPQ